MDLYDFFFDNFSTTRKDGIYEFIPSYSEPLSLRFANLVFRLWSSMITQTVKQFFLLVLIVLWKRSEGCGFGRDGRAWGLWLWRVQPPWWLGGVSFFEVDLA